MNQAVYNDGMIWGALNTVIEDRHGGHSRVGIAWFSVRPSTGHHLDGLLTNQGYVAVDRDNVFFPSIAANTHGDVLVAFTLAGPHYYPSAAYVRIDHLGGTGSVRVVAWGVGPADGFTGYLSLDPPAAGGHRGRALGRLQRGDRRCERQPVVRHRDDQPDVHIRQFSPPTQRVAGRGPLNANWGDHHRQGSSLANPEPDERAGRLRATGPLAVPRGVQPRERRTWSSAAKAARRCRCRPLPCTRVWVGARVTAPLSETSTRLRPWASIGSSLTCSVASAGGWRLLRRLPPAAIRRRSAPVPVGRGQDGEQRAAGAGLDGRERADATIRQRAEGDLGEVVVIGPVDVLADRAPAPAPPARRAPRPGRASRSAGARRRRGRRCRPRSHRPAP